MIVQELLIPAENRWYNDLIFEYLFHCRAVAELQNNLSLDIDIMTNVFDPIF